MFGQGFSSMSGRLPLAGVAALCAGLLGCGGAFGVGNSTNPGSTANISAQTSYRIVGTVGTPFFATVSDARSSWQIQGTAPTSIVIVQDQPPDRVVATKTAGDHSLLSLEITTGFNVKLLASTSDPYGTAVGGVNQGGANGALLNLAPSANPDVRFFVKGPYVNVFNALIEDETHGEVVQSRAPSLILFDSPNGGSSGRVDGIFNEVNFLGPFAIDLISDGVVVQSAAGGVSETLKANVAASD
jgi:hypothetical protein